MNSERKPRGLNINLKILLDTSVLFSPSPTLPINFELNKLISQSKNYTGLAWYIPEIVVDERKYQLITTAEELFRATKTLEKLLGQSFEKKFDSITKRIDEVFDNVKNTNLLRIFELDNSKVNWHQIFKNSAYRLPPFKPGDTEKGFRDAVVLESYIQLLSESQTDPHPCRVVLATSDNLLARATRERIKGMKNSHPPSNIGEIRELINVLLTRVDENLTEKVREMARDYFFNSESNESLFFKMKLQNKIESEFRKELLELPEGAEKRSNDIWNVAPPEFQKKDGARWTWVNNVSLSHRAYRTIYTPFSQIPGQYITGSYIGAGAATPGTLFPSEFTLGPTQIYHTGIVSAGSLEQNLLTSGSIVYPVDSIFPKEVLVAMGRTDFEINWSIEINKEILSDPRIEKIYLSQVAWY